MSSEATQQIIKRGFDDTELARQRSECTACHKRFEDLTDPIFAGHHQPLNGWGLCLYGMGLTVSKAQIAQELAVHGSNVQQMTIPRREGIAKKSALFDTELFIVSAVYDRWWRRKRFQYE